MMTVGFGPLPACVSSLRIASARVPGSETLPGSISLRRGKPAASRGQGYQSTVAALLLRAAEPGDRGSRAAREMGVGQVEEHDGAGELKEVAFPSEQRVLEVLATFPQQIADAIELVEADRLAAFQAEQFESRAVVLQPAQGLALARGVNHARNDQGACDPGVAAADAEHPQYLGEPELLEGRGGEAFASRRTDPLMVEGVEVDRRGRPRSVDVAAPELRDDPFRGGAEVSARKAGRNRRGGLRQVSLEAAIAPWAARSLHRG